MADGSKSEKKKFLDSYGTANILLAISFGGEAVVHISQVTPSVHVIAR